MDRKPQKKLSQFSTFKEYINERIGKTPTLGLESTSNFFNGNHRSLSLTKCNKRLLDVINKSTSRPDLDILNKTSSLMSIPINAFTTTSVPPNQPTTEDTDSDSEGRTTEESKASLVVTNKYNINEILLLKLADYINKQPQSPNPLQGTAEINKLFDTFLDIKKSADNVPELQEASQKIPIQLILEGVTGNETTEVKIAKINAILNTNATTPYNIQDPTNFSILKNVAFLFSFCWDISEPGVFENLLNPTFNGVKKYGGKRRRKRSKKGGLFQPPEEDEDTVAVPSPQASMFQIFKKRVVIFFALFGFMVSLITLFQNVRSIYINFQQIYDQVQGSPAFFQGEESFSLILFMRLMGQMLFNTFETTLTNIENSISSQKIQAILVDVASEATAVVVDTWGYGLLNGLVGTMTGTTQENINDVTKIEFAYKQEMLVSKIKRDLNLDFIHRRNELTNRFDTIIYSINCVTFSSLLLLNQYDPNIVSGVTVGSMGTALGVGTAVQTPITRIAITFGGLGALTSAFWRLATGASDLNGQSVENLLTQNQPLQNQMYPNIIEANRIIANQVMQHEPILQITAPVATPMVNTTPRPYVNIIPFDDEDDEGMMGGKKISSKKKTSKRKINKTKKKKKSRKTGKSKKSNKKAKNTRKTRKTRKAKK